MSNSLSKKTREVLFAPSFRASTWEEHAERLPQALSSVRLTPPDHLQPLPRDRAHYFDLVLPKAYEDASFARIVLGRQQMYAPPETGPTLLLSAVALFVDADSPDELVPYRPNYGARRRQKMMEFHLALLLRLLSFTEASSISVRAANVCPDEAVTRFVTEDPVDIVEDAPTVESSNP